MTYAAPFDLERILALRGVAQPSTATTVGNIVADELPVITITGAANFTASVSATVMTVTAINYGGLVIGQIISGSGITGTPMITALGTGSGGIGTYTLSVDQGTLASRTLSAVGGYSSTTITNSVRVLATDTAFRLIGTPSITWNIDASYQVPTKADGTQQAGQYVTREWWSDSPLFEILLNNFGSSFDLFVDDKLVQQSGFQNPIGSGQRFQLKLDWSSATDPRKPRRYRISGVNLPFGGLYLDATGSVWYPAEHSYRKLFAAFGDSYSGGVGATTIARSAPALLAAQLGMDYWVDGLSSSTWNTAAPNDAATRATNSLIRLNRAPDYVVSFLGYNSKDASDFAPMAAAFDAWASVVKSALPLTKIVVSGPWTPLGGTPGLTSVKTTLLARSSVAAVSFMDIENVVNGANKGVYTGTDQVHPTVAGHIFLSRAVEPRFRALL